MIVFWINFKDKFSHTSIETKNPILLLSLQNLHTLPTFFANLIVNVYIRIRRNFSDLCYVYYWKTHLPLKKVGVFTQPSEIAVSPLPSTPSIYQLETRSISKKLK